MNIDKSLSLSQIPPTLQTEQHQAACTPQRSALRREPPMERGNAPGSRRMWRSVAAPKWWRSGGPVAFL